LHRLIPGTPIEGVQVDWIIVIKVTCQQLNHFRASSAIVPEVYNQGLAVGKKIHGSHGSLTSIFVFVKKIGLVPILIKAT